MANARGVNRWLWTGACALGVAGAGCAQPGASAPSTPAIAERASAIVNGTRDPRALPLTDGQILALGWLYSLGDGPASNFCTGTLINGTTVVTASHCTEGNPVNAIGFGIGLLPTDPTATFRVAQKFEHPQLDLSVLRLSEDVTDRVPEVEPVPANTTRLNDALIGTEVQAGGYGETYDASRYGRWFATVVLAQVEATEILVDGQGRMGICYGDSGGPIMADLGSGPVVLGVESYGDQSCVGIDHLTRLDVVADFIAGIAGGETPVDPCAELDYLGRCSGDVAEWCDQGSFQSLDCAAQGERCAFVDNQTGYYCSSNAVGCGDVTRAGTCRGDTFVRCRNDALVEEDCAASGLVCRLVGGGARCSDPSLVSPDAGPTPTPDVGEAPLDPADAEVAPPGPPVANDDAGGPIGAGDAGPPPAGGAGAERGSATGCTARPGMGAAPGLAGLLALGLMACAARRRGRR